MNNKNTQAFLAHTGAIIPVIGGPMYPCSNPELVAAVSEAGGIGIVQPVSLTFVHGYDFREGLRYIKSLTDKPIGMNALIEKSSKKYHDKMVEWVDIALEEGVRFFITSLGKPQWIVDKVSPFGGVVYHDVTERKWAEKGLEGGVHGLIAVNNRAGGHAGRNSAEQLYESLADFQVPLVCAGGIADQGSFLEALDCGFAACQLGTRFIATTECTAATPYKTAIVNAQESDIVLSEKITGVPVSIIKTDYIKQMGTEASPLVRRLLAGQRTKHWIRMFYTLKSAFQLKNASMASSGKKEFWQAGKSVAGIEAIESVADVMRRYEKAWQSKASL